LNKRKCCAGCLNFRHFIQGEYVNNDRLYNDCDNIFSSYIIKNRRLIISPITTNKGKTHTKFATHIIKFKMSLYLQIKCFYKKSSFFKFSKNWFTTKRNILRLLFYLYFYPRGLRQRFDVKIYHRRLAVLLFFSSSRLCDEKDNFI
jgi:hypothetical protein